MSWIWSCVFQLGVCAHRFFTGKAQVGNSRLPPLNVIVAAWLWARDCLDNRHISTSLCLPPIAKFTLRLLSLCNYPVTAVPVFSFFCTFGVSLSLSVCVRSIIEQYEFFSIHQPCPIERNTDCFFRPVRYFWPSAPSCCPERLSFTNRINNVIYNLQKSHKICTTFS